MRKHFLIVATIVLSVFAFLWNGFVHFIILKESNKTVDSIHRSDMADKMWISIFITIAIVLLFTVSYLKWRKTGTTFETIKHSLFFAALMIIVVDLNQYYQYEIPLSLILTWSLFGVIEFIIYGIILNLILRKTIKK